MNCYRSRYFLDLLQDKLNLQFTLMEEMTIRNYFFLVNLTMLIPNLNNIIPANSVGYVIYRPEYGFYAFKIMSNQQISSISSMFAAQYFLDR